MEINSEQKAFDFEAEKPEIVEVPVEADDEKECGACGNLLASRSICPQCSDNEIKSNWLMNNPEKTSR